MVEALHPQYLVDEKGVARSVVLAIDEFTRLVESAGLQVQEPPHPGSLQLADLNWTREEAIETRLRLRSFEEDWDAPGMDAYDRL